MSIKALLEGINAQVLRLVGFDLRQAGDYITTQVLAVDASTNSTTTFATVMTTKGLAPGTYTYKYVIRYQSAAAATGVKFQIGFGGTATAHVMTAWYQTTGGTAANAAGDQATTTTAQLIEGWSGRASSTPLGPTLSVDTLNADMMMVIEGLIVVTVGGDLTLQHASEVAAASTVKAGTSLILTKMS